MRSRVVPHPRDINELLLGAGVKVPLGRKRIFQQLPHLTLLVWQTLPVALERRRCETHQALRRDNTLPETARLNRGHIAGSLYGCVVAVRATRLE